MTAATGLLLTTRRLRVVPLRPDQFAARLADPAGLAASLGLAGAGEAWDEDTTRAMRGLCDRARARPGDFPWLSVWLLIAADENRPVGSLCFMGPPDPAGVVEIGYGTDADRRGRGYMSEAVAAVAAWALRRPGVQAVTARTDADNPASHAVLRRCGFRRVDGEDGAAGLVWRLEGGKT